MHMVDDAIAAFDCGSADPHLLAVRQCVEQDIAPVGCGGLLLLDQGLTRLANYCSVEQ